jgi:hypothetical protein
MPCWLMLRPTPCWPATCWSREPGHCGPDAAPAMGMTRARERVGSRLG